MHGIVRLSSRELWLFTTNRFTPRSPLQPLHQAVSTSPLNAVIVAALQVFSSYVRNEVFRYNTITGVERELPFSRQRECKFLMEYPANQNYCCHDEPGEIAIDQTKSVAAICVAVFSHLPQLASVHLYSKPLIVTKLYLVKEP